MRKLTFMAAFVLASAALSAQEGPGGHRYARVLKYHSEAALRNPKQEDLREGMTVARFMCDTRYAINATLERYGTACGDYILFQGHLLKRFDTAMVRRMMSTYASLTECDAGMVDCLRWHDHEKATWWHRPQYVKDGKPEPAMSFDIGEFYDIPELIGYRIEYEMAACMNPAGMLRTPTSQPMPRAQPWTESDEPWKINPSNCIPPVVIHDTFRCNLPDDCWRKVTYVKDCEHGNVLKREYFERKSCDTQLVRTTYVSYFWHSPWPWLIGGGVILTGGTAAVLSMGHPEPNTTNQSNNNGSTTTINGSPTTSGQHKPGSSQKPSTYGVVSAQIGLRDLARGNLSGVKLAFGMKNLAQ